MDLHLPIDALGLTGLRVTAIDDTNYLDEVFIFAECTHPLTPCLKCLAEEDCVYRHGTEEQKFRDVPFRGKKASIIIDRRRYKCTQCGGTWFQFIPVLHPKRRMTGRLEEYIAQKCLTTPNLKIADELGIDEGTVRGVFNDFIHERKESLRYELPQVLGIDEIHLRDIRCVLTDVANRTFVDILPSRKKEKVADYLGGRPDRANVEVITADMWKPYHQLADEFFPDALVIIDKFHVVRMANKGFDIIRKHVGRQRSKEQKILLKDERFLLYKRSAQLEPEGADKVNEWLEAFPELRSAYDFKERFSEVYNEPNRKAAAKALEKCLRSIPVEHKNAFHELLRAVENWKPRILNYFDASYTNAYTESFNAIIRQLDRVGRGYSFEVMRARLLYNDQARSRKTSTRSRRPGDSWATNYFSAFGDGDLDLVTVEYGPDIDLVVAELEKLIAA